MLQSLLGRHSVCLIHLQASNAFKAVRMYDRQFYVNGNMKSGLFMILMYLLGIIVLRFDHFIWICSILCFKSNVIDKRIIIFILKSLLKHRGRRLSMKHRWFLQTVPDNISEPSSAAWKSIAAWIIDARSLNEGQTQLLTSWCADYTTVWFTGIGWSA